MKQSLLLFIIVLLSTSFNIKKEEQILGEWLTGNKKAKIKIFTKNSKYYGVISWLKEPLEKDGSAKKDKNNPVVTKQAQLIIGLELLRDFSYAGNNEWEDGYIYDPESGKTYSCNITLKPDGRTLDVRGYIGLSFIGRTDTWTK